MTMMMSGGSPGLILFNPRLILFNPRPLYLSASLTAVERALQSDP